VLIDGAEDVDGRKAPQYSSPEMFKKMLAMFLEGAKSINSLEQEDIIHHRLEEPTSRTIAYYLEHSDANALNDLLWKLFYTTLRSKRLDCLRGLGDKLALALDGVYLPSSKKRHCDKCLTKTIDGVIYYYHAFLVASVVDKNKKFSLPVAVIPLENTPGSKKQDCELKAAHRLLDFLRRKNPYAKFNLSTDGLYLSADFIAEAVERGHSVTMPLAKENMVIWEVLDVRLGNTQNKMELLEDKNSVTVWWDDRDVSEFWAALKKRNPKIKLYGLKRLLTPLQEGEKERECIVVTTLCPTNEKAVLKISDLQRAKWQEENKAFNTMKNLLGLKHIFNHKASAQVFQFAALALNLRAIFFFKCRPQKEIKKPLSETSLMKAIVGLCRKPSEIFNTVIINTATSQKYQNA
jgi:hypothetical protein